jgi:formylglycine-generating enzyme required for sulfatase activity
MAAPANNLTLHRYKCTNKGYTEDLGDGVPLTLMLIPAGEFMMGASEDEPESQENERPQHLVKLSQFLMGRYPVTQAQWRVVAGYNREEIDLNPAPSAHTTGISEIARITADIPAGDVGRVQYQASEWRARSADGSSIAKDTIVRPIRREGLTLYVSTNFEDDNLPVEQVSWYEATEFCKRLSTRTGKNYHLPSEAQWEYACRAETQTAYHFGDKVTQELANYSEKTTTTVGQYPANRWGLYDMHGNVWEWCQDFWHENYEDAPQDGSVWLTYLERDRRVNRGGSWFFNLGNCRSASRYSDAPNYRSYTLGLRVCCSVHQSR